jgi:hypothetical protein
MIRLNHSYSPYVNVTDPNHPGGAAIDTTTEDEEDGTPIKAALVNDDRGWKEAAVTEARGSFIVTDQPDRPGASDVLNAIKIIINRMIDSNVTPQMILAKLISVDGAGSGLDADLFQGKPPEYYLRAATAGFFVTHVCGPATVIPWTEFGIEYERDMVFCVFITAHGNYPDYVAFPYEVKSDGIHVYPQRLINGKLVAGTGRKKWGTGKWGTGKQHVPGKKWGMGKWGEGKWDASRIVGGEAWGVYAPMPINIQLKEV